MDEFPGLLSREFGLRPQGRSAPMTAAKSSTPPRSTPASAGFDDLDGIFASKPKPGPDYDAMFDGFALPKPPTYDRPVYDEDLFEGVPGMKPAKGGGGGVEDVFASLSVGSGKGGGGGGGGSDLLGDVKDGGSDGSGRKAEAGGGEFEDLIPGFGGGGGTGSGPAKRDYSDTDLRHSSSNPNISPNTMSNDPFADLESTSSVPSYPSSGLFVDPLDEINVPPRKSKSSASSGLFDDLNAFSGVNRSASPIPSNTGDVQKDKSSSYAAEGKNYGCPAAAGESTERFSSRNSADTAPKKRSGDIRNEPEDKGFDIPIDNLQSMTSERRFGSQTTDSSFNHFEMNNKEHSHVDDDIWLTVSEIPLFTQPTRSPPPSRRPPPFNNRKGASSKRQTNASFPFSQHTKEYMPSESFSDSPKTFGVSSIDELEDFAMGKSKAYADEQTEVVSSEEDNDSSTAAANSAAAMKDAMDRAEAKMRQARELREREKETRANKSRESKNNAASDFYHEEHKETSDSFDPEQEQLEREEKEREQRRLERERQRALQRERERASVDKVLREARARAAADARQKAERAAVEKANAEARERAARAAVQRVTAERREKEAAEARERAAAEARAAVEARERAAAEAKERANIEAREREAKEREARDRASAANRERERAAVQRAAAEARRRHERAAVERANEESRQRAAAAAREKQRKNENDLDSFFGAGNRATSEPKQRAASAEFSFDAHVPNKGSSAGVPPASSNSSSSGIRKTASTNMDDLISVFGAPSASGDFQDIEGETEERRRARLERHQRTLERAAKALAEKNERDMQVQNEQVEKDRIAESLDVEIRRWAAGKEGNLRALLSTLQYILWPGCGWQPVSLTDLITGANVKKVYRKATLHIHPDKVQQKGANLEQKIIAEKVFDLLKEAWNKLNSEELF